MPKGSTAKDAADSGSATDLFSASVAEQTNSPSSTRRVASMTQNNPTVSLGEDYFQGNIKNESRAAKSQRRLTVAEIVNPVEAEAETAILAAIESREKSFRKERSQKAILRTLTEKEIKALGSEDDEAKKDQEPNAPPSVGERSNTIPEKSELTIPATQVDDDRSDPADRVGKKLFALAAVIRNIHTDAHDEQQEAIEEATKSTNQEIPSGHKRLPSKDVPSMPKIDEGRATEADMLANNAALVFRGKMQQGASTMNLDPLNESKDPKKNDDVFEDERLEEDIEGGPEERLPNTEAQRKNWKSRFQVDSMYQRAKEDWDVVQDYIAPWKKSMRAYAKVVFFLLFLPSLGVAALLFYVLGNPLMNRGGASISWFVLFLGIRQVITFTLAKLMEIFIIDILAVKSRIMIRLLGPLLTLMVLQSKGWPQILFWWSVLDLIMLSGGHAFANHWLFYQDFVGLFNEENPAGNITSNSWNYNLLIGALVLSVVAAVKRFVVGLFLGARTFTKYGEKLASVIHGMIMISQIARLARQLEREHSGVKFKGRVTSADDLFAWKFKGFSGMNPDNEDDEEEDEDNEDDKSEGDKINELAGGLSKRSSTRQKIAEIVEAWEEPEESDAVEKPSIQAILQFKQTLAFMDLSYPFSAAFGLADRREHCIESSQEIYECLLLGNKNTIEPSVLEFKCLETLMRDQDENLDETRLKDLVRVFRPDRQGRLALPDFVRSVDRVYKDLRLLRASIHNSSQIDAAMETIINAFVYFTVGCCILAAWGIDPFALFISLSSGIVVFAFVIGTASSKYFEGLLFILQRDPYDIGDRISVNGVSEAPELNGVMTWFVENVTLYYTTIRLAATNEIATIANSSLASSRIINANRSPKAIAYILMKFPIDIPYEKVQVLKKTVEAFVKARPREWIAFLGMRATRVEADLAFIEYIIVLQHRESWQMIGAILQSKADVITYCLEVQKQLGMRYSAPSTPVDLSFKNGKEALAALSERPPSGEEQNPSSTISFAPGQLGSTWRENPDTRMAGDPTGVGD